jgi:hypothetical protein
MASGFSGGLLNALGSEETLENVLNTLVDEGEHATLERVEVKGVLHYSEATLPYGFMALALVVTGTVPANTGSLTTPAFPTIEADLKAIVADEFAFHVLQEYHAPDFLSSGDLHYWKVNASLNIPAKWRELGICRSDEDIPSVGNRSFLAFVANLPGKPAANTVLYFHGSIALRYNVADVSSTPAHLLEGIE